MDDRRRQDRRRWPPFHCLHPLLHGHHRIVDYYLGAILPSPESVRIDVSSISFPTLTKVGLLPFLRHSHGKPFLFCDVPTSSCIPPHRPPSSVTVPAPPQSGLLSQLRLVSFLTQHGFSETALPPPHPLHRFHPGPGSGRFPRPLFPPL
jgi:hypothetical protein